MTIEHPRPFFAEIPYYLWGTVNYDSDGDCRYPTDRMWTWLYLTRRDTNESLEISSKGKDWSLTGNQLTISRLSLFLYTRCGAVIVQPGLDNHSGNWDHEAGLKRAGKVAEEFSFSVLKPFDTHLFWGSWKWIGWFATEFTWVGRWIMVSVMKDDPRGVPLCIDWLRDGTYSEKQSEILRYALHCLTGETFASDKRWITWYKGGFLGRGAEIKYPEPDFDTWLIELKSEYGDSQSTG